MSPTSRLFVALWPPDDVRDALARAQDAWRDALGDAARLARPVDPRAIHLTLLFLGDVPADAIGDAGAAVCAVAARHAPMSLALDRPGCFPNARRARVLWIGLAGDVVRLASLAGDLGLELRSFVARPDDRPFSPHLTLARMKFATSIGDSVERVTQRLGTENALGWTAGEITLVRSTPGRSGERPSYDVVARAPLRHDPR